MPVSFNMSYDHFKVLIFRIAITQFKIKILIKAYAMPWIIFLPLSLIIGQSTLILKQTA